MNKVQDQPEEVATMGFCGVCYRAIHEGQPHDEIDGTILCKFCVKDLEE